MLALSLVPSIALADDQPLTVRMQHRVEEGLVKPLAEHENNVSRFSRMRRPPRERRVRITEESPARDQAGRSFLPFAVDGRFTGDEWHENEVVGCVYTATGDMFVKVGDAYRPATILLGVDAQPVAGVCKAVPR